MAELLVVLFVVLLIFGAGKIPALGDGLGRAIRNFRKSYRGDDPQARPPAGETKPPARLPPAS